MADIIITPGSSLMSFTSSLNYTQTLTQEASGSLTLQGSGSTGRTDLFTVNGNNGTLFSVSDDLSNSLFSVNTIAGLPVIEAFANNSVVMGAYGQNDFIITGSKVGIGTSSPQGKLSVDGGDFRFNYGNAATGYYAWFNRNSNHDGGILLSRDNSTLDWQINNANSGNLWFYAYGLGSVAVTMQRSNGNVGIGTTSPSEKLEVNGKTKTTTLQVTSGATNGYVLTSDASGNGTWQAAGGGGGGVHIAIPPRSGQGYGLITSPSTSPQTYSPGSNLLCWFPFIPSNNITIDRIIISVTSAATSGIAVFTIYSNTNGMPDRKLFASSNIDCSTTGYKSIATTQTFTAGTVYWFGLTFNNNSIGFAAHPPASSYSFAWLNSTGIPFAANNCVYFITTSPGSEPNTVDQSQVGFSFDNILNTIIRAV